MKTQPTVRCLLTLACLPLVSAMAEEEPWVIDSQEEWEAAIASSEGISIEDGMSAPAEKSGTLKTMIKSFDRKRSASSLTVTQSPIWQNWNPMGAEHGVRPHL